MTSIGIDIKNLIAYGNAELTVGDNYGFVRAEENSGVFTDYFKSIEDAVQVKFKGRTTDAHPIAYKLCSYDESGAETLIYSEDLQLDTKGCFDVSYTFDPIHLAVYKNAAQFRLFIYSICEKAEIYLDSFSVEEGNDANKVEEEEAFEINNLTDGGVYVMQKDGSKIVVPVVPKNVVFIGNSILLGMGTYGMCATSDKADYAWHVQQEILKHSPDCVFHKVYGSPFERSSTFEEAINWLHETPNLYTQKPAKESFSEETNLVIIQLSDNVSSENAPLFKQTSDVLIKTIKEISPKARIVWVYGWFNIDRAREILPPLCRKWSIELIDISGCRSKEHEATLGQISLDKDGNEFVVKDAWITHPGDKGMKAIADKLIEKLGMNP